MFELYSKMIDWILSQPSYSDRDFSIYDLFSARKHIRWCLEELRLLSVNQCSEGHPDAKLLNAILKSVPSITSVVRTRTCECRWV